MLEHGVSQVVELVTDGVRIPPRAGHAAAAVPVCSLHVGADGGGGDSAAGSGGSFSPLVVFGGWRQRWCAQLTPCGEFLNDVYVLTFAFPSATTAGRETVGRNVAQWSMPAVNGVPPAPRRGHTLTYLADNPQRSVAGSPAGGSLLVLFGSGWLLNSTNLVGKGSHLNDAYLLSLPGMTWSPLITSGAPPSPRGGHTAALAPDGTRLIIFGGVNAHAELTDAHILDTANAIWWQLHASGDHPYGRPGHTSALFGSDVLFLGAGHPTEPAIHLLSTLQMEVQTSAPIAGLARGVDCELLLGTGGSSTQVWSCGSRLRVRRVNDTGRDFMCDDHTQVPCSD